MHVNHLTGPDAGCCTSDSVVPTKQMDLIDDENSDLLHIVPILPASADSIPLLWCSDDKISLSNGFHIGSHIPSEFNNSGKEEKRSLSQITHDLGKAKIPFKIKFYNA